MTTLLDIPPPWWTPFVDEENLVGTLNCLQEIGLENTCFRVLNSIWGKTSVDHKS